ncbi:MAG: 16S rRNA (cytosine(1402)-N(4))-methyltransferase RsmH [Acidobacteriota bacterium]
MSRVHRPVLVTQVVDFLAASKGGVFVDATFGGGGHTRAILASHPRNEVVAIDRDREALAAGRAGLGEDISRVTFVHDDYRHLGTILEEKGGPAPDGLVADLGISTLQLSNPARGFSFDQAGPLDMRIDRSSGPTAEEIVNNLPEHDLRRILRQFGEERAAVRICRAIVRRRARQPFSTTDDLAAVVSAAVGPSRRRRIHPATRTFQALRIVVNDELTGLDRFVTTAATSVRPRGRVVFIAFHSLEDRPVKQTLRRLAHCCVCPPDLPRCGCHRPDIVRILTSRAVRPGEDEIRANPASRSARLRAAERLAA